MRIKTKVALAVTALFAIILGMVLLSLFYIRELSNDAKNILKDNYESVEYCKKIMEALDSLPVDSSRYTQQIEKYIHLQEQNVTEAGEDGLTLQLRKTFERMQTDKNDSTLATGLRRYALALQEINMKAIARKNEITSNTAVKATNYLLVIASIVFIAGFTFILNFPGYIANPIVSLTNSIKSIANKNYEERLDFNRSDEFGELAEAFNRMAEKMDEYEHSNLAKILFEKKRIETIINRMSDPVIGLDEKKKVVFVNDQALNLLNLSALQVMDRYAPDLAVENDLFRTLIRPQTDGVESPPFIKIVVSGKENYFSKENIAIQFKPTGETKSTLIGNVILLKNITPYKEPDLAKTNFIATISHELKTPIASLQMGIQLLHDQRIGTLNDEQNNIVKTVREETERLSKLTHELLDLAQVESGNIRLNFQTIKPEELVADSLEAVKFQAERKKVKLEAEISEHLPPIHIDKARTSWVLVNLLTNAIRYSPENETVLLNCYSENHQIVFSVKDFGQGIEKQYLEKVFEKFFQVPGTVSGSGLGLAISKEFIEAQHGSITVESEPGKGSTFRFSLPEIDPGQSQPKLPA